jgi:hypothetical protein
LHFSSFAQVWWHWPQLPSSLDSMASQPFAGALSQSARPFWQIGSPELLDDPALLL